MWSVFGGMFSRASVEFVLPMQESAETRKKRLEEVARLTERLHSLEDLISSEGDQQQREIYQSEKAEIIDRLRQIRRN